MTEQAFARIAAGLRDALAIARGDESGARMHPSLHPTRNQAATENSKETNIKRDMDLIRAILLKLEDFGMRPGTNCLMHPGVDELEISGFSAEDIDYHMHLLIDAGLVDGRKMQSSGYIVKPLTWAACDFLDKTRDNGVWDFTKETAKKAGGFSVELLGNIAAAYIKGKVNSITGLTI